MFHVAANPVTDRLFGADASRLLPLKRHLHIKKSPRKPVKATKFCVVMVCRCAYNPSIAWHIVENLTRLMTSTNAPSDARNNRWGRSVTLNTQDKIQPVSFIIRLSDGSSIGLFIMCTSVQVSVHAYPIMCHLPGTL